MKVLHINGYFLLPDDFNGTLTDALQEYVNYRQNEDGAIHVDSQGNLISSNPFSGFTGR